MGEHNHKGLGVGQSIPTVAAGSGILVQAGKVVNLLSFCQLWGKGEQKEDGTGHGPWGLGGGKAACAFNFCSPGFRNAALLGMLLSV